MKVHRRAFSKIKPIEKISVWGYYNPWIMPYAFSNRKQMKAMKCYYKSFNYFNSLDFLFPIHFFPLSPHLEFCLVSLGAWLPTKRGFITSFERNNETRESYDSNGPKRYLYYISPQNKRIYFLSTSQNFPDGLSAEFFHIFKAELMPSYSTK